MLGVAITTSSIARGQPLSLGAGRRRCGLDPEHHRPAPRAARARPDGRRASSAPRRCSGAGGQAHYAEYRQVTIIDREGGTAHHSGAKTLGTNAVAEGTDCVAAGNLLSNPMCRSAMVASFARHADLHLAERLLRALEAGSWPAARWGRSNPPGCWWWTSRSGRWSTCGSTGRRTIPSRRLRDLWERYQPQMKDYVTRALDPRSAPAYGVPGDP